MHLDKLRELLDQLVRGELNAEAVIDRLAAVNVRRTAATSQAQVDLDRQRRCGYPEVVFCPGKTAPAIAEIFLALQAAGQECFATRASPEQAAALCELFPGLVHNPVGRTLLLPGACQRPLLGRVVVVTAGTGDRPVAEEAAETARWMSCEVDLIIDVGVAGPHRLVEQLDRLHAADALVVVAGMEGALPSVVGGHVDCPVVACPTSVGYGASFGGIAALLGMLNSCAANVTVVNIDAGFKAGYVAGLIARRAAGRPPPAGLEPVPD